MTGNQSDISAVPNNCEFIEVYAFMQRCLPNSPRSGSNAIAHLAELFDASKSGEVADKIELSFPQTKVAAFATFMPELTADTNRQAEAVMAVKALKLLIDVVRVLQGRGHPIKTVELVGGSRIQGVYQTNHPSHSYVAQRLGEREAMERLIDRLKPLAEYASNGPQVFLAVELEPGPLFTLSGRSALVSFCESLESSDCHALKRSVGVNLDIPHWHFLAKITPEWLSLPAQGVILRRIAHAHVCDHHIGHFSDTVPGVFNDLSEFFRWFMLLKSVCGTPRGRCLPEFSGFVSCEMEACKEASHLLNCFQKVSSLL